ncbi:MAG: VCBS repeat-containing protein [Bacteroidetes bacterium]|nr:VCBS repeat-containing protein [Bacteroidota bacterium]
MKEKNSMEALMIRLLETWRLSARWRQTKNTSLFLGVVFLLLPQHTNLTLQEKEPFHIGGEKGHGNAVWFTLALSPRANEVLLVVLDNRPSEKRIKVFDAARKQLFESVLSAYVSSEQVVQFGDRFYFFARKLLWIDLDNFTVDSTQVSRSDYTSIQVIPFESGARMLASYSGGIDIYDPANLKLTYAIQRSEQVRGDDPQCFNNFIFFENTETELAAYDLMTKKVVWKFNTGVRPVSLLGIKVGSMPNYVSSYRILSEQGSISLVMVTFAGDLYKLNPATGSVIQRNERFKGTGNNAGLITNISLVDMNQDGTKDIVGPSVDHNVYCIDGRTLSVIWEYNTGNESQMPCSFADINGDGTPEVFSVNDEYNLTILDGRKGTLLYQMKVQEGIKSGWNQTEVLLADLNGNGLLDVIVKGGWDKLRIFELGGISVPKNAIVWIPGRYPTTQVR